MVDVHNLPNGEKVYFCGMCEEDFNNINLAETHESSCVTDRSFPFRFECYYCPSTMGIRIIRAGKYKCRSCEMEYTVTGKGKLGYEVWQCDYCHTEYRHKVDVDHHELVCKKFIETLNSTNTLFENTKKKLVEVVKGKIDELDVLSLNKKRKEHTQALEKMDEEVAKCKTFFIDYQQSIPDKEFLRKNVKTIDYYKTEMNEFYKKLDDMAEYETLNNKIYKAKRREQALDFDAAINIWEELGLIDEAARVRKLQAEMGSVKVAQSVVQGDQITEVKDSVINKSNIGTGGDDKFAKLEKLTVMKEKGLIDDDEFKQMKKEILGK